jgi:hypothetical protein
MFIGVVVFVLGDFPTKTLAELCKRSAWALSIRFQIDRMAAYKAHDRLRLNAILIVFGGYCGVFGLRSGWVWQSKPPHLALWGPWDMISPWHNTCGVVVRGLRVTWASCWQFEIDLCLLLSGPCWVLWMCGAFDNFALCVLAPLGHLLHGAKRFQCGGVLFESVLGVWGSFLTCDHVWRVRTGCVCKVCRAMQGKFFR